MAPGAQLPDRPGSVRAPVAEDGVLRAKADCGRLENLLEVLGLGARWPRGTGRRAAAGSRGRVVPGGSCPGQLLSFGPAR
eukprot:9344936-Alexandrium_andersonii.AAC.1